LNGGILVVIVGRKMSSGRHLKPWARNWERWNFFHCSSLNAHGCVLNLY